MTKFARYRLRLTGQPVLVALLQPHIVKHQGKNPSLGEARELRKAVRVLFGGAVDLEIVSVGQGQARVKRL